MTGAAAALADGSYTVAVRPYHVRPRPGGAAEVRLAGQVMVTELSGSESSAHFRMGTDTWVSLAPGVHPFEVGSVHEFYMDPANCYYFAPDGALAA